MKCIKLSLRGLVSWMVGVYIIFCTDGAEFLVIFSKTSAECRINMT